MEDMPQQELGDQQTPNSSQNAPPTTEQKARGPEQKAKDPEQKEVTLELHKYILLLASLVATMTYAAGFSPPGGVWQTTAADHLLGDPIIRDTHHKRYVAFFYSNATAFAASLVVVVLVLILASLDDKYNKAKHASSTIVGQPWWWTVAVRTLQAAMVVDLLSLMGAYAAGTCRDTFTTVYSSVLVGAVVLYLVFQMTGGSGGAPASLATVEERQPVPDDTPASPATGNPSSSSGGGVPEPESEAVRREERPKAKGSFRSKVQVAVAVEKGVEKMSNEADKAKERSRKVLMLLATFAVSITYSAGLSMPGGFWDDTAGPGHRPGDAILKDSHNARLAVFLCFNTLAFVASLLIIVVLLDNKPHHRLRRGFIVVALLSLIVAYNAGSCRETDTTVYVAGLIAAVVVYILLLLMVARAINWSKCFEEPPTPSTRHGLQNITGRVETEKEKAAKKARSLVLLLATLAATITYQAGLDPPGGVWQDNSGGHTAGDPILLTTNPRRYKAFFYCNSVSLVASLVALVPVKNKFLLEHHVLEAIMILDLFGLIGAYAAGSCRDVNTSIHAMALAGAVLVYVVIHVIFITLDDDTRTRTRSESDKDSVEKQRKRLLLFAIFAATITYQAGLTPPGGFLQSAAAGHNAGDPVLLYNFPRRYKAFFYCNSVSFMLSIALIILLVNPNVYRPAIRTHALSVCTAAGLFGLMGAYAAGSTQHLKTSVYIFVLVAVVIFFIVLLFLVFWYTGTKAQEGSHSSTTHGRRPGIEPDSMQDKKKREYAKSKYLMLLGILVASVTYQAGLQPPGGDWQSSGDWYEAGDPVMHDNRRHRYLAFFYSNSTSFMASVVVILLLLVENLTITSVEAWIRTCKTLFRTVLHCSTECNVDPEIGIEGGIERRFDKKKWRRWWLVVMNTTIVLDLLGLLGAYAAGSSRRWKTSVYVLLLVIAVLAYMGFHLLLSYTVIRKRAQSAPSTAPPIQA